MSASRSKARSRADWNRRARVLLEAMAHEPLEAGGEVLLVTESSGGSSFRIAAIVSPAESPRNARRPESIS